MKSVLLLILTLFSNFTFGQYDCFHMDCFPNSPPEEIRKKIYLDTSYHYAVDEKAGNKIAEYKKDSSWIYRYNYLINCYNIEDTLYFRDTLMISEGLIYNNKKNDAWTDYSYLGQNRNYPSYSMISVKKLFYLNEIPILSICQCERSYINVDFDLPEVEINYPWELEFHADKESVIINLKIKCAYDSNRLLKCCGKAQDSIQIFYVDAKYLQSELNQLYMYKYLVKD